jgi:uncharacterized membrane protein (DUF485 family)
MLAHSLTSSLMALPMRAADVRHRRLGNTLFFGYLAFYTVFVLINAFSPDVMERQVIGGLNLALTLGLALIAVALVLALIHGWSAPIVLENSDAPARRDRE